MMQARRFVAHEESHDHVQHDAGLARSRFCLCMRGALVMGDYNVSHHWSDDEPVWVKSLVSSLSRRSGRSTVLPLTVAVEEILRWVELASGVDAWVSGENRSSLRYDLDESVAALGADLCDEIKRPLRAFRDAFIRLDCASKEARRTPPGMRTDAIWADVASAAESLLSYLTSDAAVGANWDDLVAISKDRSSADQEYQPIANLLFDQLRLRGADAKGVFRHLVDMLAYGRTPEDFPTGKKDVPLDQRLAAARTMACTPATVGSVVVWLGYQGRAFPHMAAGNVSFFEAHWTVPNAGPDGQSFEHKAELWSLVEHGLLFKVAKFVNEESDVDSLVRVDLGETTVAGALARAVDLVDTILNVSIHRSGGSRPHLAQSAVLFNGKKSYTSFLNSPRATAFPNDHFGADATADAIMEFGPRIAASLATGELPRFLAAALEVQTMAEHPFSRDMALRSPSDADIRSVIPLADRVVQHVAAHAATRPEDVFATLGKRWPHARWLHDVSSAAHMCIAPMAVQAHDRLRHELTTKLYASDDRQPFVLLVADRAVDLLSLCQVESDRKWIERVFRSISDHPEYLRIVEKHQADRDVLECRRKRTRNALVHGNPASFAVIESVRPFAEFLSGSALHLALESFVDGSVPAAALKKTADEHKAMLAGTDAESYWRSRLANQGTTTP